MWWVNLKMVDINFHDWRRADINACFLGTLYITYLDRCITVLKGVGFWLQYSDMLISNCLFCVSGGSCFPACILIDSFWYFILCVLPIFRGNCEAALSQLHAVASLFHVFRNCAISMRISIQFLQCNPVAVVYLCFHTPSVERFRKRRWVMNRPEPDFWCEARGSIPNELMTLICFSWTLNSATYCHSSDWFYFRYAIVDLKDDSSLIIHTHTNPSIHT